MIITSADVDEYGVYLHGRNIVVNNDFRIADDVKQDVIMVGNLKVNGIVVATDYKLIIGGSLEANAVYGKIVVRGDLIITDSINVHSIICSGNIIANQIDSLSTIEASGFIHSKTTIFAVMGICAREDIIAKGCIHAMGKDGYIESKNGSIVSKKEISVMNHIFAKGRVTAPKVRFGTTIDAKKIETTRLSFGENVLRVIGVGTYFVVENKKRS